MVNLHARMRKLKARLLDIRLGPGAVVLPHDVKRLHMDFAIKFNKGHFGARKFWRNCLPRLKYHNPAISMTVNRTKDQDGPASLTVFFAPPARTTSATSSPAPSSSTSSNTAPSEHTPFDRTETIDMKHIWDSEIMSLLMTLTKATPVVATPEEEAELEGMREDNEMRRQDALIGAKHREKLREEKALLDQARGAVAAE